jgi:hypothetical protein
VDVIRGFRGIGNDFVDFLGALEGNLGFEKDFGIIR